jgi:hypothetical protein
MVRVDATYPLGIEDDPHVRARADNGDLWVQCWKQILSKHLSLKVVKVPRSHESDAMISLGIMDLHDKLGNDQADRLAELGAGLAKQSDQIITDTNQILGMARYIQIRLAQATNIHISDERRAIRAQAPPQKTPRPKPLTHQQLIQKINIAGHELKARPDGRGVTYRCDYCGISCARTNLKHWVKRCKGHAARTDHRSTMRARPTPIPTTPPPQHHQ